jgi:ATPase subunit of ABC transporter with duplicated ATPase domains
MTLIKAEEITIEINGTIIIEHASIEINEGERIALIGRNGVGKTTFMKSLIGVQPVTKGAVHRKLDKEEWAWMDQDSIESDLLLREWVESDNEPLWKAKQVLKKAERELSESANQKLISDYTEVLQAYIDLDGYEWEGAVERQLLKMGLPTPLWDHPFENLSGGQKTRAKLARVMIDQPKLLLLDEPTNHLDVESLNWLTACLKNYKGAVLFISHERAFIDQVAHVTYELSETGTKKYAGGYSVYKALKEEERKAQDSLYRKQENEKKKLVEAINTYRHWFKESHDAASERDPAAKKKANKHMTRYKAKEKALERLEESRIDKPKDEVKLGVQFEQQNFSSKSLLRFEDVNFMYDGIKSVVNDATFGIGKGDRIAIVGKNGAGKTTLLKLMTGQLTATQGEVKRHPQLKLGFFMQELEGLSMEDTVLEQVLSVKGMTQTEARTLLASFLFRKEDVFKKVSELSMGEKCRVAFVKLYFSQANLLIFDEPTNYLDISSREKIEEALKMYPGAVVVVSHDPYLLDQVANRVIELDQGKLVDYPGTYQEWQTHETFTPIDQENRNEKERLEMKLVQLLATEDLGDEDERAVYWQAVKQLKMEIQRLEEQC